MIKKFCIYFFILILFFCSGYKKPPKYVIEAEKNAFYHNNLGLNHLRDRVYYAAIQEFKIAISLSPSTQATAIFYNNLGETYNFIGYPDQALPCFEDALKLYGLNLKYYINLVQTYIRLGLDESKIKEFSSSKNIYDKIKLGLLYIERDEVRTGISVLDDVCISEPDLLITPAIKKYLDDVIKQKL